MQPERLGSILKSRALHSATHASCVLSHPAAPTQAVQSLIGCAVNRHGNMHPTSVRVRSATFTTLSGSSALTVRGHRWASYSDL